MAFDNDDVEPGVEEEVAGPPPEESSNRPFIIVAAILGAIMLLSLLCVAGYALFILPQRAANRAGVELTRAAQDTQVAQAAQETQLALKPSPTQAPPTSTPAPTNTPVLAPVDNATATLTGPQRQGTLSAMLTQAAVTAGAGAAQPTPTVTQTALPQGGIFDDWNPALLAGLALVLVAVIILARRMRTT